MRHYDILGVEAAAIRGSTKEVDTEGEETGSLCSGKPPGGSEELRAGQESLNLLCSWSECYPVSAGGQRTQ